MLQLVRKIALLNDCQNTAFSCAWIFASICIIFGNHVLSANTQISCKKELWIASWTKKVVSLFRVTYLWQYVTLSNIKQSSWSPGKIPLLESLVHLFSNSHCIVHEIGTFLWRFIWPFWQNFIVWKNILFSQILHKALLLFTKINSHKDKDKNDIKISSIDIIFSTSLSSKS